MKIYAIGDLHFDSKKEKPMNIFGDNWINHEEKIINNWESVINEEDLILIPGDISWATKLDDAKIDLSKIDNLSGSKIIGKGNHDYWWSTSNKLDNLQLKSIKFLKNNFYEYEHVVICGTRGWDTMDNNVGFFPNEKIYLRELNRLKISLEQCKKNDKLKIAMLHFPPFNIDGDLNEFALMLKEYKVDICIYGHLHGEEGFKNIKEGLIHDIQFYCVASDYLQFKLKRIL